MSRVDLVEETTDVEKGDRLVILGKVNYSTPTDVTIRVGGRDLFHLANWEHVEVVIDNRE